MLAKLIGHSYEIIYEKGKEIHVVDALSRIDHDQLLQLSLSIVSSDLWQQIQASWTTYP